MRLDRCRRLRSLLTSYVDEEGTAAERRIVADHLEQCGACRRRLARERAVRYRLQRWAADARARGAPLSWSETLAKRPHPVASALLRVAPLAAAAVVVGLLWNNGRHEASVLQATRGHIADSVCAGSHAHASAELGNMSRRDCVRRCVERGAEYVFISDGIVYAIRNQDFRDVIRLAGQDVELEGEVRQKMLTVSRVRPLASPRDR